MVGVGSPKDGVGGVVGPESLYGSRCRVTTKLIKKKIPDLVQ